LEEDFGPDQFLPITFYLGGTYSIPEGNSRASWYGITGTPHVVFDGIDHSGGGQPSGSMYATYLPLVVNRMGLSSPLIMNAAYVALGNDINVSVTIQVDEAIANTNNQVLFLVCQEGYHAQSNMVVDMLDTEPFTLDTVGQSTIVSRDFTLGSSFTEEDLRLIVLVQNTTTKEILQATLATADYAGTVIVDAEPNGVNAPWRLQGPEGLDFTGAGDRSVNMFFTGDYTLTFLDVPAWTTPANNPQTQTLAEDAVITFTGQYTDGPFSVLNAGPIADTGSGQGVALVDYDNDGDLDIHVVNNDSADQLLRNDGNLEFTEAASGLLADGGAGRSSAWADFNRDGFQDVLLGRDGEANLLLAGDGTGGFLAANCMGIDDTGPVSSISWVDFDLDGNLDIYASHQGQENLLLRSYGDLGGGFFLFSGVGGPTGNIGDSNGANWIDLNGDQRPELYIVNSFSGNVLLNNSSIGFDDVSYSSGLGDVTNGVGSAWGDFDNDGDFDLYLSNEAMADHIFRNGGDLLFNPILGDNTSDMGNGRGVVWADLNNDTNLDIYLVRHNQPDLFLLGDGLGGFQQIPVGPAEADGPGNTVACGDMDSDGDLDLFITREGVGNVLLSNDLAGENNFFELTLVGSENQPDAIGAVVRLTAGGITQMRHLSAGSGYLAMDAKAMHFGLADISIIDEVQITWPDGTVQSLTNLAANQFMQVTMGEDVLSPVDDTGALPRVTVLGQAHPNPFNPSTTIGFALAQSGPTRLDIFTVDGRHVRTLVSEDLNAGEHSVTWTGQDESGRTVASGAYFYRLSSADGAQQTGRMALVK
jgi:enediyne biosynthesis protein E4